MVMGANFGDIDNDGFLDIYLGTGSPSYASLVPSLLLRNNRGQSFVDVTAASGTGELHKGHGVAFADLDHDGDQEIVFEVGGATPGDRFYNAMFQNPGQGNNWINVKLVGRKSNRAAIGTRIKAVLDTEPPRTLHRWVTSGSSFGANPLEQMLGLGQATRVKQLEVYWPTSKTTQVFHDVSANQALEITERMLQQTSNRRGEALMIVSVLAGYFTKLWKLTFCRHERMAEKEMASYIGVPPFFIKEYLSSLNRFSLGAIENAFVALLAADNEIKGGSTREEKLIMTLLVGRLVRERA